jgi:PAS domain S-box-containing protein
LEKNEVVKKHPKELLDSEKLIHSIFRSVPIGIGLMVDHVFKQANARLCEMTGYSAKELVGRSISSLRPPGSPNFHNSNDAGDDYMGREKNEIRDDGTEISDIRWLRQDGEIINVRLSSTPIDIKDPSKGVTVAAQDITDRIRIEKALRESETKLKEAQEMAHLGYWFWDVATGDVEWSEEVYRIFRLNPEEFTPQIDSILSLSPFPGDQERDKELIRKAVESRERGAYEQKFLRPDGGMGYYFSTFQGIYDDQNNLVAIKGVVQDITERKEGEAEREKLQSLLNQAQKMESIGTLAGGIAHNFNNVLMGIQGRVSLMMVDKDSSHPDYEHLNGIEEYIRNAAELTKDLLGFARGVNNEVRPTDLNTLIKHENRMFGRTKKEVRIRGKYEKKLWPVEVDRGQIQQVFLNLYVNAWQAMADGGHLYVRTENTTLDGAFTEPFGMNPGRFVKVSVTDTGTGMDDATRAKIFDPFFSTRDNGLSSGLGLASVYGIIKNHGGFINVYSEKGKGTTFNIYLPVSDKKVLLEGAAYDHHRIQYGQGTVLLVDDEGMVIDVGRQMLKRLGYHVLTAQSGQEALNVFEKQMDRIDLVILDLIMPEMGGGETYDRMKDMDKNVNILLSSGYSADGQAKEIMDRGSMGFIQKPFSLTSLSIKVKQALREKQ